MIAVLSSHRYFIWLRAAVVGLGSIVQAGQAHINQNESKVLPYTLPAVLSMQDGTPVRTAEDWIHQRRPEILRLYENNVHGHMPAGLPRGFFFQVVEEDRHALGGTAHRKQVEVRFSDKTGTPSWPATGRSFWILPIRS